MYQALYRKYRPKTFSDVMGQDVIVQTLMNAIKNDRLSHAYLFAGPRGTGKTSIAKILADIVNCESPKDGEKCGKCVYCTQSVDQSIDIIEIDAASNNGIDEIRELKNKVNLVPNIGKYKIYIIDEVHMLTIGAFNALLKTLEEPPAHVIFVLATTDPHKVPITILSRCQKFDFKKINQSKLEEGLKKMAESEHIDISDEAIKDIARLADGGFRDAISTLDQVISYSGGKVTIEDVHMVCGSVSREELQELITSIVENNIKKVYEILKKYDECGKSMIKIAEEMIFYLRDLVLENPSLKTEKKLLMKLNTNLWEIKSSNYPKISLEVLLLDFMSQLTEKTETANENLGNIDKPKDLTEVKDEKSVKEAPKSVDKKEEKPQENYFQGNKTEIEKLVWEIKSKRIDNTLAKVSKTQLATVKDQQDDIRSYVIDDKYAKVATLLSSGKMMAASDEYIVFSLKTEALATEFNYSLDKVEKLLNKIYGKKYKAIATFDDEWVKIRDEFKAKKRLYQYTEESNELKELTDLIKKNTTKKDEVENLFGSIIEYN